jgi:hypothetical protein
MALTDEEYDQRVAAYGRRLRELLPPSGEGDTMAENGPYIVTAAPEGVGFGSPTIPRRAVATLEEAFGVDLRHLPVEGGTIGPLPGGTVIKVEPTMYGALRGWLTAHGVEFVSEPGDDGASVLAAYNAAQEG